MSRPLRDYQKPNTVSARKARNIMRGVIRRCYPVGMTGREKMIRITRNLYSK